MTNIYSVNNRHTVIKLFRCQVINGMHIYKAIGNFQQLQSHAAAHIK